MNRFQNVQIRFFTVEREVLVKPYKPRAREALRTACRRRRGSLVAVKPRSLGSDLRASWQGILETVRLGTF